MHRIVLLAALVSIAAPAIAQETRASAAAKFDTEFAASDTNKDGVLSQAEVEARIDHMRIGNAAAKPGQAKQLSALWFARADANHNGKVTKAEAQALLAATFAKYDANGDGKVGTDERATARAAIKSGKSGKSGR